MRGVGSTGVPFPRFFIRRGGLRSNAILREILAQFSRDGEDRDTGGVDYVAASQWPSG